MSAEHVPFVRHASLPSLFTHTANKSLGLMKPTGGLRDVVRNEDAPKIIRMQEGLTPGQQNAHHLTRKRVS